MVRATVHEVAKSVPTWQLNILVRTLRTVVTNAAAHVVAGNRPFVFHS